MNANLSLMDNLVKANERIGAMEEILGKGLNMPFNPSNSGARKILYATQSDHIVPLSHPETPIVQTGYEIRFGDLAASVIKAETDLKVEAIIPKFSFLDKYNYYMILKDTKNKTLRLIQRISYEHTTECYGYIYNTKSMDLKFEGSHFNKGDIIRASTSFDEYGNRQDGINALVGYIGTDMNTEDSVIISESAAEKFRTSMIKKVVIILNDNNIPLNIHGTPDRYKCIPDIGEHIHGGILFASRLERKEEAIYTQAYDRLSQLMISDEKFTVEGRVEDIEIYSNNPTILENNFYNAQLSMYHKEKIRMFNSIVSRVEHLKKVYPDYTLEYDLQKLYYNAKQVLNGAQYTRDGKVFSNTIIEITVVEEAPLRVGDKISDRYGGKGVISDVKKDEDMPLTDLGERLEIILSPAGCPNRENMGQLIETTINHCGIRLNSAIRTMLKEGTIDTQYAFEMIIRFINLIVPEEALNMAEYVTGLSEDSANAFLESILDFYAPIISTRPISDNLTIDQLAKIYEEFPWLSQSRLSVPLYDSCGNPRYIPSRRTIIAGRKYMHRLKQFAEEKFSVISLSSVNIKNQNTKSKSSKNYKSRFTNTPVNLGDMESADLGHMGVEYVVADLMIHSLSPQARRLYEQLLTDDPGVVDIKLDENSRNRSVEIVNTYLKTKGLELCITKFKKVVKPLIQMNLLQMPRYSHPLITTGESEQSLRNYYNQMERVNTLPKQLIQRSLIVMNDLLTPSQQEYNEVLDAYYADKALGIVDEDERKPLIDEDDF